MFMAVRGFAAHRVNIVERIGGGDLAKGIGIVHRRREKIQGLHQRQIVGNFIHARVFRMFISGQQTGIGDERQIAQNFGQVTRTDLTGSTCALNCFRQTDRLFFFHFSNLKNKLCRFS